MARSDYSRVFVQDLQQGARKRTGYALGLGLMALVIISCGLFPNQVQPGLPTATVTPLPSLTPSPIVPLTTEPMQPSLLTSVDVPCFTGPGIAYERVAELGAGDEAELVGQAEDFWVVKTSGGTVCWVPDQGVIPQGDYAALPAVEPPPIPTPAAPVAPEHLEVLIVACTKDKSRKPSKFVNQFHLYWQDLSNNEDGFRVYRDGSLIAELPADKTEVIDQTVTQNLRTHYYYVVAYNDVGEAKSEGVGIGCSEGGGGGGYP